MKRNPEIVVLSDLHLGTHGCHAAELLLYLKSIEPHTLILNGDIVDIWQFKKRFFPKTHIQVLRRLLKLATDGTKIYYLTGNHDDVLRKYGEFSLGQIELRDHLVLQIGGKKHWFFHGDVFDGSVHQARWLAKLGGQGYDFLIRINRFVNRVRGWFGFSKISFAGKIKQGVKRKAAKMVGDFEETAIRLAHEHGYDAVICGHIHRPQLRKEGSVFYMNSGDWVENLTALEFSSGKWTLFKYHAADFEFENPRLAVKMGATEPEEVFAFYDERSPVFQTGL